MPVVIASLPFGDKNFDALPDQFIAGVTEHRLGLRIRLDDDALLVHCQQRVWDRFKNGRRQQGLGQSVWIRLRHAIR